MESSQGGGERDNRGMLFLRYLNLWSLWRSWPSQVSWMWNVLTFPGCCRL
jgi:hypothetical protein